MIIDIIIKVSSAPQHTPLHVRLLLTTALHSYVFFFVVVVVHLALTFRVNPEVQGLYNL